DRDQQPQTGAAQEHDPEASETRVLERGLGTREARVDRRRGHRTSAGCRTRGPVRPTTTTVTMASTARISGRMAHARSGSTDQVSEVAALCAVWKSVVIRTLPPVPT